MEASWAVLEASWANLEVSWTLLGRLGGRLGPSCADLEAILAVLEAILGRLAWEDRRPVDLTGPYSVSAGWAEADWGVLLEKEPKQKPETSSTPCTPVARPQGAADRRRLRRITAAPCLLELAVSQMSSHSVGTLLDGVFPQASWKPSGER